MNNIGGWGRGVVESLEARLLLARSLDPSVLQERFVFKRNGGALTEPAAGKPLLIATRYLSAHAADLGLKAADVANPIVTDNYTDRDTGVTHIYLRQRLNNLPVDNTSINFNIARDGRILSVGGAFVADAASKLSGVKTSTVTARRSIQGLKGLGLEVPADSKITPITREGHTIFKVPSISLDPMEPLLHYVATASGGVAQAWEIVARTPDGDHWYDTHVDAATGSLLYASDWVDEASYNVFPIPTEAPNDGPGGVASRQTVTDPQDPTFSPFGWHDTNGIAGAEFTTTVGNNVSAQDDTDANNTGGLHPDGGASLNFNFPLDLTQSPSTYQSAAITNLFYWNNILHDIHAQYGFTDVAGNFQTKNYSNQGLGNDQVQADAQDGSGTNNANFATPPDGQSGRMQMYLFTSSTPNRDGDFDADVIVHEYGHGVSNRLTGGPANSNALNAVQSGGMGEGWSDWWSLMLTQKPADTKTAAYPVGTYVLGQATSGPGIRRFPYSFDMTKDPLTIDAYGTSGSGGGTTRSTEVHNTGEIWCTTLWDMSWLLIDKYGYSPTVSQGYDPAVAGKNGGNNLALQLIMDALKLQPANPSFLQARDAILQADQVRTGGANQFQIWTAFARRGMGASFVDSSSSATSVTPAFDIPAGLLNPSIISQTPVGVATTPVSSLDLNFSKAMDPTSFSIADDVNSFTGPGSVNLKSQITGFSWLNGNLTLRLNFATQSTDGTYTINIGPQILAASDGHAMDQNSNGTSGEAGDTYTGSFGFDSLPLAVASTDPANGTLVSIPFTTLDVHFNEPIAAASIGTSDLTLSQGTVTGASVLNSTTARYTLNGINTEGTLTVNMAAGAVTDANGFGMQAYSGSFATDIVTRPIPAASSLAPAGSMIYQSIASGTIGAGSDVDNFTISLDAGQTLTAILHPTVSSLRPAVTVLGPGAVVLETATAAAANQDAVVQSVTVTTAGTYTVSAASAGGAAGQYSIQLLLNAAAEAEEHNGGTDDTIATAQPIPAGASLPGGGDIRSIVGTLPPSSGVPLVTQSFESPTLPADWSTFSSDSFGRIQITTAFGASAGTNALLMDRNDSSGAAYTLNEAIWTVDLTGITQSTLSFAQASFGDEDEALAADFTGHSNGDGVSISANGTNWHRVWQAVSGSSGLFSTITVDLAAAAAAAGMTLGAGFKIKFQQYDNFDLTTDGRAFDAVTISTPANSADYYAIPLSAGQHLAAGAARITGTGVPAMGLYDSGGNLLASGTTGNSNVQAAIADFVAPAAGNYYLKLTGNGIDYGLTLTRGATFDLEPNNTIAQAQPLGATGVAVGFVEKGGAGIEPDDFATGTVLTSVVPGITLSASGDTPAITSQTSSMVSTGTRVFAHGTSTFWNSSSVWLRADFTGAASSVSIDLIPDDSSDPGIMRAFDSAGNLLQELTVPAPPLGSFTTMTITRPTADIAYIMAAGLTGDTALLDHLVVGGIGAGQDFYSVTLNAGGTLGLRTTTPGDGSGEFGNTLDSMLELYDPAGNLVASNDNGGADGRNAALGYTASLPGTYRVRVLGAGGSFGEYALTLGDALNLTIPTDATEGQGTIIATLTASTAPASDVTITLGSSNSARASVPATVILPAGQTSVPLPITIVDNGALDGPEAVVMTATATGYFSGARTINVHDNETATLTVNLPSSANEAGGSQSGSITSSAAPTRDIIIQLTSSNTNRATVPATVTLLAGQTSANFSLGAVNNTKIDFTESVNVTAAVENWTSGVAAISVIDNDAFITVSLPSGGGWEGQTLTNSGTVQIGGTLPSNLVVSLASDDTSEATVPATVTILAGQTSATFTVTLPTDALKDGSQAPTVTGSASGLTSGNASLTVHDANPDHLSFDSITGPKTAGVSFSATARSFNIANETIVTYGGSGTLGATGNAGSLPLSPTSVTFTTGVWTGNVTVNAVDQSVALTMSSGGLSASSSTFAVQAGALAGFIWSTISTQQVVGAPFSATLTAKDANGFTVNTFNGTASLSGQVGSGSGSSIVISEIFCGTPDTIEFTNASNAPVSIGGWQVYIYDIDFWPNPRPVTVTIPAGTTVPAGGVFRVVENGTNPGSYPNFNTGENIDWTSSTSTDAAVLLRNGSNQIVDFFCGASATASSITSPSTIPTTQWQGATAAAPTSDSFSFSRTGGDDHNNATDWVLAAPTLGTLNGGLTLPFPPATSPISINPTSATFVNGVWSGQITVAQAATNMYLRADDGAGHVATSGTFSVVTRPSLQSVVVNDGAAQRSMVKSLTLTFDEPVTLDNGAIELNKRPGIPVAIAVTNPTSDGKTFVVTFTGPDIVGGSLTDGLYDLTVNSNKVHNLFNQTPIAPDSTSSFYRLFGDSDGDRDVDLTDGLAFAAARNTVSTLPAYRWYFDFDGDLDIDDDDALAFQRHQGQTMPATIVGPVHHTVGPGAITQSPPL